MDIRDLFKSFVDSDENPVVMCDLDYRIVYMNAVAEKQYGSIKGKNLELFMTEEALTKLNMTIEWFREDKKNSRVFAFHDEPENVDVYIVALRGTKGDLCGFSSVRRSRIPEDGKNYDLK